MPFRGLEWLQCAQLPLTIVPRDSHSRNQQRPRVGRRCFCVCVLSGEGELASRESISKVEGPDETHSPRLEYSIVVSSMTKRTERRVHLSFIIFGFSDRRILLSFGLDILQSSRVGSNSIVYGQKRAREREGGREGKTLGTHEEYLGKYTYTYVCVHFLDLKKCGHLGLCGVFFLNGFITSRSFALHVLVLCVVVVCYSKECHKVADKI